MSSFSIIATAKSIPKRVVSNDDLTHMMDTSDEWIRRRTGIHNRHIATTETTTTLATDVATTLLQKAQLKADSIDFIVVATMSPDEQTPAVAASVQGMIHATNAMAFDINSACSGFVYGLDVLHALLATKPHAKGILIGAEVLSKLVNWHDRSTAVLFGDGAGGALVTNDDGNGQYLADHLQTFGELGQCLTAGHAQNNNPFTDQVDDQDGYFHMDGHRVYDFATRRVPLSIEAAVKDAGLQLADVDKFVLHQANARIVKSVARRLHVDFDEKFPVNIDQYGNTAAASEPILLAELVANGQIHHGDIIALSGFGGGLSVGTVILKF